MKKHFIKLMFSFLVLLLVQTGASAMPDLQTMDGPHYLTDDGFSKNFTYNNSPIVSGWDSDIAGGSISYSGDRLLITDTSKLAATKMSKKLRSHSEGIITAETAFSLNNASKGAYLRISGDNGTKDIFKLTFGGKATLVTANGSTDIIKSVITKQLYGVKIIINLDTKKYQLYIDGKYVGNFDFLSDATNLDFIEVSTGVKEKGIIGLIGFKIYTGFALNETFYGCNPGALPEHWTNVSSGGAVVQLESSYASFFDKTYAHLIDDTSAGKSQFGTTFDRVTDHGAFELRFATEKDGNEFNFRWNDGQKTVFNIYSEDNVLYLNNTKVYDYIKNVWYALAIEADFKSNTADFYLNNRLIAEKIPFTGSGVDGFVAETSIKHRGELSIDDILAYCVNEPDTYVPEPVVAESDDFAVGVQTCDMWREGSHYGWDVIIPYQERVSYLGLYDEGSREVADWEIKWMVEHGVDYRMSCWFSPRYWSSEDGPMKIGSNSYGLVDGYMRSKYSDKMKYAIMWENAVSNAVDVKTFREYLVPYWVEWFLKDSRYMVIDNKPLIYIYDGNVFYKDLSGSDMELARENIEFLRNECKKLGYDDAVIIFSTSNGVNYSKDMGIDGLYNYNYGASEFTSGKQEQRLSDDKKNYDNLFIMPSISQGQQREAWMQARGPYASVEDFEAAIKWVRDDFYDNYDNYSLSEKAILLNTWNEYGEGHYIAPCYLEGFGYMDAAKNVFAKGGEHTDIVPTDEEKSGFCILSPENRKPHIRGEQVTVKIPDTVAYRWSEDDLRVWGNTGQIENFRYENGVLLGTSVGIDPKMYSPDNLEIDTTNINYIKIRIKQSSAKKTMSIFFITNDDTKWNEAKGVTVSPDVVGNDYHDVYFQVVMRPSWKGTLKQLRIDPLNTMGDFEIESIELLKGEPSDTVRVSVDGTLQPFVVEKTSNSSIFKSAQIPVMVDGKVYLPYECWLNYCNLRFIYNNAENQIKCVSEDFVLIIDPETGNSSLNGKPTKNIPVIKYLGNYVIPVRETAEVLGYKVGWDSDKFAVLLTSPPPVVKETTADPDFTWNFNVDDDMQKWITSSQVSDAVVMDGILAIKLSGNDGQINLKNISMPATKYKTMFVCLKNKTTSKRLELFFTKNTDTTMNQQKSFQLDIDTNMEEFVEYEIDLTSHEKWADTITNLRLDPATAAGDFEIDYIRFSEY